MKLQLDLQDECGAHPKPDLNALQQWADHAYLGDCAADVCLRIVDRDEMQTLNGHYRGKDYATNVLSFCAELPPGITLESKPLGDIVICAPVVSEEAGSQGKTEQAHWAHMLVHGMLHLQGFDHIDDDEATIMESRETALLRDLGFPPPYEGRD